jgi:hypothetical protein
MSRALYILALVCAALAAGCGNDAPTAPAPEPLLPPVDECDCDECGDDCDPAWNGYECVLQTCLETGFCLCYLESAFWDCPESGCCGPQYNEDGELLLDENGFPMYGCVVPWCTTDDDCAEDETCVIGPTCDQNYGACDAEEDDHGACCPAENDWGACCWTGEVDESTGLCVCSDAELMVDDGDGCACPAGMRPDEEGQCVCEDFLAEYDPMTGECHCPEGTTEEVDEDGVVDCIEPVDCEDEHAEYNPETDMCECIEGYQMGEVEELVTPRCVPEDDGPEPDAAIEDADPDEPDADSPDGPTPDAAPATDADAGPTTDAGPGDAAGPSSDACPTGIVHCQVEELP